MVRLTVTQSMSKSQSHEPEIFDAPYLDYRAGQMDVLN